MNEDKQMILGLLLPALQATDNLHDLIDLKYDPISETVTAYFPGGTKVVSVAADSGTAMIVDVIRKIV